MVTNGRCRRITVKNGAVQPFSRLAHDANGDRHVVLAQVGQAPAGHERVGILDGDDRPADAGPHHFRRARPGPADVRARLERAVERRASRPGAGVGERQDLGVRLPRRLVRPASDDDALVVDDHRPDHRIGAGAAAAPLGECERAGHVHGVGGHGTVDYHFSSKSASTYSSGANGIRSSMPSPTPT